MKINKNQELRSSSILGLFCLVGLSLTIIATPWNRDLNGAGQEKALHRAEIVGYQIVQLYREASKHTSEAPKSRAPASASPNLTDLRRTGSMGTDPWGQAYNYRILSADQSKLRILVWSSGPDKVINTKELENEDVSLADQPSFAGDDLGIVMSMNVN